MRRLLLIVLLQLLLVAHALETTVTRRFELHGKVFSVSVPPGVEPIDAIAAFRHEHNLSLAFQHTALETFCSALPCTRAAPIVFSAKITGDNGASIGNFELLDGDEPADAVAAFCRQHTLGPAFQRQMIGSICAQASVRCLRHRAVALQQGFTGDHGSSLGVLTIYDDEAPPDAVFAYLQPWFPERSSLESMLQQVLGYVCSRLPCDRTIPRLFHRHIQGPDGVDLGVLDIYYGQEPIDVISAMQPPLDRELQLSLLQTVCAEPLVSPYCTRDRVLVFSAPVQFDADGPSIAVTLYDGDEVADVIYALGRRYNLTVSMRHGLFDALCNRPPITCTRGRAKLYDRLVTDDEGNAIGSVVVLDGDEAADNVFAFAAAHSLPTGFRDDLLNRVCHDLKASVNVTCSRWAPLLASIPIKMNMSDPNPLGYVDVLDGDEPVDAVYRFGVQHNLDAQQQASIKDGICNALDVACTRERSLVYVAPIHGEHVPFYGDDEPADVVYWYGTLRNWTFFERQEWLHALCRLERAAMPLLNCTRAEARVFHLPVMDTATEKLGDLDVYEDQEPVDVVYAFLDKHDLFQTAPINETLLNLTCSHVSCARLRPRRILFSLQATYAGLPHKIEYVPPEDDWVCTELYPGQKRCEHYVQVRAAAYCAKYMATWATCPDIIGRALRSHLDVYEAAMWRGKDLYAKLGLVKGASSDEIEHAYHVRVLRYNNGTEPQKYEKLQAAYDTLHDPVKKHYYDLPCMKFFGLCGKRQPDGGISISAD
ncbi:hypothetical protein SDRG_06074 [Saprolegnia diclina VS20]|uniref:J domain-containing protein n=1 Tax=Saprolegnia diclina (strain VS20) TaxID=1156394 RepID=T0QRQ1_SAPDV|nr:hypothetical protein SDRG_06074 [Saprolegnia diclina VS20]EQC36635.1 hypothetical protein SDRG_06074 [Saprolegnia diclina VS20]|eukprot:XP_008610056.1 hypothetical protein SDRG_06074 [Saprolegnia diclina VS20]